MRKLFHSAWFLLALACSASEPAVTPSTGGAGVGQGGGGIASNAGAPVSGSGGVSSGGSSSAGMTSGGGGAAAAAGAAGTADGGGASGAGGSASGASGASGAGGAGGGFTYEPIAGDQFDDMLLYEGNPPNFKTGAPKEALNTLGQFTNVSVPMLRRFAMDGGKATGFGYLVFPGGGYSLVDMQLHVAELAKRVAPLGVAVFGLKYRVGGGTSNAPRDALLDAKRAIRIVKQNAARWGVDVARLGVIGYSAGSHMTLNLAANFDAGNAASADAIERHSSRPAFIGSMATWAMGAKTSPFTFPSDVPPAFFCHAENDKTAPIELPKAVEALIRARGAATKLDFYATGAHSTCHPGDASMEGRNWPDKFWPWVQAVIH
jgi:acetyl esterase/lipase